MSEIIASTYEMIRELGSGGGGVVYLARHLRLNKLVVMKADKRSLRAKPESLRREVDALKNLSHAYIPQVYDFFTMDGTVYTVMDYIEGESLDKPLKRGIRFPQAQVIKWAQELLDALVYLHTRPPYGILHGDIKPANIMLTPEGDIRLIDFNIALALGEEGAVRVGYSRGYASPEHYTSDYTPLHPVEDATFAMQNNLGVTETVASGAANVPVSNSTGTGSRSSIVLDARSDVYSLGATLYHLFSGKRPNKDADLVVPLSSDIVSDQISNIISKAMSPLPENRYQTAAEMLNAFQHLRDNDQRTINLHKRERITAGVLLALFLTGGALSFTGSRRLRIEEEAARVEAEAQAEQERIAKETEQAANSALEYIEEAREALRAGNTERAKSLSLEALALGTHYDPAAQYVLYSLT